MKCSITAARVIKAHPCRPSKDIRALFKQLGVSKLTPKQMAAHKEEVWVGGWYVGTLVNRIWAMLYAAGLKKATLYTFLKKRLLISMEGWDWRSSSDTTALLRRKKKPTKAEVDAFITLVRSLPSAYGSSYVIDFLISWSTGKEANRNLFYNIATLYNIGENHRKLVRLCTAQQ